MGLGKKGKLMKTTFIKKSQTGKQVSGPRRPKPKASVNKEDRCRKTHGNRLNRNILGCKVKSLSKITYKNEEASYNTSFKRWSLKKEKSCPPFSCQQSSEKFYPYSFFLQHFQGTFFSDLYRKIRKVKSSLF